MVATLLTASDEQAAYVCGILWEATGDLAVAQQVRCPALPPLPPLSRRSDT